MKNLIRKISIGKDYKNEAMHYSVGQEVYGGHTICDIIEEDEKFSIYIMKKEEILKLVYIFTSKEEVNFN